MECVACHENSSSNFSGHTELLSRRGYTILAIIMGMFSVAGIILNVLVIVVTVRYRKLRQPLSYALVNLAVCDLGCAVFGGVPTTLNSAMGYFTLGRLGCVLGGFAVAFFGESTFYRVFPEAWCNIWFQHCNCCLIVVLPKWQRACCQHFPADWHFPGPLKATILQKQPL